MHLLLVYPHRSRSSTAERICDGLAQRNKKTLFVIEALVYCEGLKSRGSQTEILLEMID